MQQTQHRFGDFLCEGLVGLDILILVALLTGILQNANRTNNGQILVELKGAIRKSASSAHEICLFSVTYITRRKSSGK
jgi:hypothetical protein